MAGGRGGAVLLLLALCLQPPPAQARSLRFVTLVRGTGGRGGSRAGPGRDGRAGPGWRGAPRRCTGTETARPSRPSRGTRTRRAPGPRDSGSSRRCGARRGGRRALGRGPDRRWRPVPLQVGMRQQWELGQALRRRYRDFLSDTYRRQEVSASPPARGPALSAAPRWARGAARAGAAGGSFGKGNAGAGTRLQVLSFLSPFPLQEEEAPKRRLCAESGRGVRRQIQPELWDRSSHSLWSPGN